MRERFDSVAAYGSLLGASAWAAIAVLAGRHRAPFGIMELLLLLAVLVVVPLGTELAGWLSPGWVRGRAGVVRVAQFLAGCAVVASMWLPPGRLAAAFAVPWLVVALVALALAGIAALGWNDRSLLTIAVAIACADLAFGSVWLVMSRAGFRPMGFQEPIVLLTAIHYHYSGFATALIAAATLALLHREREQMGWFRYVVWLVLVLPYVIAAGFVFSPALRMVAAVTFSVSVAVLAGAIVWLSSRARHPVARVLLRTGGGAVWLGMALATAYAITDYAGRAFLTMPGMASTHGLLNGLGFALLTTLGFLIEWEEQEIEGIETTTPAAILARTSSAVPRKPPAGVSQPLPEFVAHEFYDR